MNFESQSTFGAGHDKTQWSFLFNLPCK